MRSTFQNKQKAKGVTELFIQHERKRLTARMNEASRKQVAANAPSPSSSPIPNEGARSSTIVVEKIAEQLYNGFHSSNRSSSGSQETSTLQSSNISSSYLSAVPTHGSSQTTPKLKEGKPSHPFRSQETTENQENGVLHCGRIVSIDEFIKMRPRRVGDQAALSMKEGGQARIVRVAESGSLNDLHRQRSSAKFNSAKYSAGTILGSKDLRLNATSPHSVSGTDDTRVAAGIDKCGAHGQAESQILALRYLKQARDNLEALKQEKPHLFQRYCKRKAVSSKMALSNPAHVVSPSEADKTLMPSNQLGLEDMQTTPASNPICTLTSGSKSDQHLSKSKLSSEFCFGTNPRQANRISRGNKILKRMRVSSEKGDCMQGCALRDQASREQTQKSNFSQTQNADTKCQSIRRQSDDYLLLEDSTHEDQGVTGAKRIFAAPCKIGQSTLSVANDQLPNNSDRFLSILRACSKCDEDDLDPVTH